MKELEMYAKEIKLLDRPVDDGEFNAALEYFGNFASIELLESVVSHYKAKREKILTDDIPTLLAAHGLSKATTESGLTFGLQTVYSVSKGENAFEWLNAHGMDAIIKTNLELGKGQFNSEIAGLLQAAGVDYVQKDDVHPMTLKKAVSEYIEETGDMPPEDAIKVKMFTRAKISA